MENVRKKERKTRGPPPFLSKVYEFVDDPNTNKLVSWGNDNQSFIVWDQFEFSTTILLNYFKHGNFSSFIYQLNCYGFKKIESDRWEYANKWFRAGEKQLLCNIKRRTPIRRKKKSKEVKEWPLSDPKKLQSMEAEIKYLKSEHNEVQIEIQECREYQNIIEHELRNIKPKEENEMLDLIIKSFVKSHENFKNGNDASREEETMTSDVALLNLSLLQGKCFGRSRQQKGRGANKEAIESSLELME